MRTLLALTLILVATNACFASTARARRQQKPADAKQTPAAQRELTASEKLLVSSSREALIKTGLSEAYFDSHFRVMRVVDQPADRRVVWSFSVNGFEATVSDTLGFYTEGGRRIDTHSVASTLPSTSDITRTITRRQAERIMRRCLGSFTNSQIEYRAHGEDGHAALLLTAQRIIKPPVSKGREARERREREEREQRERREQAKNTRQLDELEDEGDERDRPVILLGTVNLVTGQCKIGRAQSTP